MRYRERGISRVHAYHHAAARRDDRATGNTRGGCNAANELDSTSAEGARYALSADDTRAATAGDDCANAYPGAKERATADAGGRPNSE